MTENTTSKRSGGQLKKLFFDKRLSDTGGTIWKISTWKVLLWMIAVIVILIILYSFFVPDQMAFLKEVLFYSIITMIIIAITWLVCGLISKGRKLFVGFILAWILILGMYIFLGSICQMVGWIEFHYGFTTWMAITALALLGAKRIDGNLDKNDVGYGLLVLLIIFIGNVPVFDCGGFFAKVDSFIELILSWLPFSISPENLTTT
jgi:hypothetical protein